MPEASNNHRFGNDFLIAAKLVINASQKLYYFSNKPQNTHDLYFENYNDEKVVLHEVNLRLGNLLGANNEVFALTEESTRYVEYMREIQKLLEERLIEEC